MKSLLLSAIYNTYDVEDRAHTQIGAAIARAYGLGLHHRAESGNEDRSDIFFSLYNIDREIAITARRQVIIRDDDYDVQVSLIAQTP